MAMAKKVLPSFLPPMFVFAETLLTVQTKPVSEKGSGGGKFCVSLWDWVRDILNAVYLKKKKCMYGVKKLRFIPVVNFPNISFGPLLT